MGIFRRTRYPLTLLANRCFRICATEMNLCKCWEPLHMQSYQKCDAVLKLVAANGVAGSEVSNNWVENRQSFNNNQNRLNFSWNNLLNTHGLCCARKIPIVYTCARKFTLSSTEIYTCTSINIYGTSCRRQNLRPTLGAEPGFFCWDPELVNRRSDHVLTEG
jgi:hypothetical protein